MQWMDDLDDLISAIRLLSERIRSVFVALSFLAVSLLVQIGGVLLALRHPPLASAVAMILVVTLMYRSVTSPHLAPRQIA